MCRRRIYNPTEHPRYIADHVRDHKNVMHVMVIARGYIDPATTRQSPYKSRNEDKMRQTRGVRTVEVVL
jgi:hypothetical protein